MALAPLDSSGTLRVTYETDRLMPAADVAVMLKEVAAGFDRYAKRNRRYSGLRLAVTRIEVSSLIAELVVISVATGQAVIEHRDAIYGFVGFIADALSIAQGFKRGKLKPADSRMIDALQKPVAEAGSQQVNIFVVGDGNTLTIDQDAIRLIQAQREQASLKGTYAGAPMPTVKPEEEVRPPKFLTLEGKFGTVFDVRGQWYVRLEGERGVLNPLHLETGVTVYDGHSYEFHGVWDDRHYRIWAARPLSV